MAEFFSQSLLVASMRYGCNSDSVNDTHIKMKPTFGINILRLGKLGLDEWGGSTD